MPNQPVNFNRPRLRRLATAAAVFGAIAGVVALRLTTPPAVVAQDEGGDVWLEDAFPGVTFSRPVFAAQAPDGSDLMYVVEQRGRIWAVEHPAPAPPQEAARTLFLDLRQRVSPSGNERGLFCLAFHPDYATNGRFFVHYTQSSNGQTVLAEYGLRDDDATLGDPASERVLLTRSQPAENHNGGMLAFGPDGMLYLALGDGGGGGDPWEQGQDLSTWLGKILRIDVDDTDPGKEYAVPADNPFVGRAGALPEIWAYGLRNPWRFSFDRGTGDLWCGDVGQSRWEEISVVGVGQNMGWDEREGFHDYERTAAPPPDPFVDPVHEHRHLSNGGDAGSITGGYVYRGTQIPSLAGTYVYGDYVSGWVDGLTRNGDSVQHRRLMSPGENIASFAEDRAGELYVCSFSRGGRVLAIRGRDDPPPPVDGLPALLSDAGVFADVAGNQPADGALRYGVRSPLWSDGADKERFVVLPEGTSMTWHDDDAFGLPMGAVAVKTFSLPTGKKTPVRLETRLIRRADDGFEMATYRWRADGSDADRVDDTVTDEVAGVTWEFPGREACRACHTEVSGGLLGLTARQVRHHGSPRDVLRRWTKNGVLTGDVPKLRKVGRLLPLRGPGKRTKRARSYLDANCASCHRPGAPQPAGLDLRASTDIAETGLLDAPTRGAFGIADARIVAPRDPDRSVLLTRLDLRGDEKQMPPLGTNVPDDRALMSLRRWIRRLRAR